MTEIKVKPVPTKAKVASGEAAIKKPAAAKKKETAPKAASAATTAEKKVASSTSSAGISSHKNKKNLHPKYRVITVRTTSGEEYKVRSTYHNDLLVQDIDPSKHPAWSGKIDHNKTFGQIHEFNKRYKSIDLGDLV